MTHDMANTQLASPGDDRPLTGFSLAKAQSRYLEAQMKKVSRSFALVVSFLERPLQEYLSAAYLVCRVVDNIEDVSQSPAWQRGRFAEFYDLLAAPDKAAAVLARWATLSWPGLTDDERRLMAPDDGAMLWEIYRALPRSARQTISHWAREMAQGMAQVQDPEQAPRFVQRDGIHLLASKQDYDRYCYFVAGTVGHLATQLTVDFYGISASEVGRLFETSEACGRGLQKTNIVKDFRADLDRRVSYLPDEWLGQAGYRPLALGGAPAEWKRLVIGDVLAELREATQYVLALPYRVKGYRVASLLCLFPAYQTLLRAAEQANKLFTADHNFKITRFTMVNCIRDARSLVHDNQAVLSYSQAAEESIISLLG